MKAVLIVASIVGTLFVGSANATLESRLGGQAYYDTDLDISWLTDANMNGNQTWQTQMTWADNLIIAGTDGWRLPSVGEMYYLNTAEGIDPEFLIFGDIVVGNDGPFTNTSTEHYWTNHSFDNRLAYVAEWIYYFGLSPALDLKSNALPAWAVHDGDVGLLSPVPEPESYALFLAGLGLVGFMARRRKVSAV